MSQQLSVAPICANDTTFRAWGSAISAAIATVGLVQTSDTGQINWSTVTHPAVTNAKAGYEIWRFSDSLQATSPVFIRVDYGCTIAAANPQIWLTVGTATDGAGNITASSSFPSSTSAAITVFTTNTAQNWSSLTVNPFWVDSDGGSSLMLAGWVQPWGAGIPNSAGGVAVVERTRDWDGTPNGEGVIILTMSGGVSIGAGSCLSQMVYITNSSNFRDATTALNYWAVLGGGGHQQNTTKSALVSTTVYAYPVFTGFSPKLNAPSKHVVAVWSLDLPANQQETFTMYGASHTFVCFGAYGGGGAADASGTSMSCAWRIS